MSNWLLYGATGYTGELIARAAAAHAPRPILAGRNAAAVERLARELDCEARAFALDDADAVSRHLEGVTLVLNCAGPFSATAGPMMQACLTRRAHYLDITGEIEVFERAHGLDAPARAANVVLCPGVGFDVVPSDCLAATLRQALPDATHLTLGFDSRSPPSRGTAKTMVEGLKTGSRVRVDGRLVSIPFASRVRDIDFGEGKKLAIAIPWGDVSTAFRTTGIPNVEVYVPVSPRALANLRRLGHFGWLLRRKAVQSFLKARIAKREPGPDEMAREKTPVYVWGEVENAAGRHATARVRVPNGYTLTRDAAVAVAERLLAGGAAAGFTTPARLMGPDFVTRLPGVSGVRLG